MADCLRKNLLIGIGHPLLDMTATVEKSFLLEYNLKENDAVIMSENHKNLQNRLLERYEVAYTVGGSIQNTLRIVQWITELPNVTTFFGSVGNDQYAKILYEQALLDGVNVRYKYISGEPTGTCIVLITGENRSLCTNPGSSKYFDFAHLLKTENQFLLDTAKYYYMGGFFLNVSLETVRGISKLAAKGDRQFLFNLSAPFICYQHRDVLLELLPYIDVIFGNKSEIEALSSCCELEGNTIDETIVLLSNWKKINSSRLRLVVVTQSEEPVLVGIDKRVLKFSVPSLKNKIVDTNGAGDAFVGGFLSQFIQDQAIETCIKCGIWAASQIIQQIGCTYTGKANFQI
ncbi:uncharacterized protein [Diabrotica undecimpunctata]|uniref:uncharacterized protein n=1 Tax=Diabrotica undecimpunctata TaxID=50387 RepID=UPI003B633BED